MKRIFLSHSSENNAAALALGAWLESLGWSDYFLDVDAHRGISPGERWLAALAGAVDRCEAVIFLVSPAWCASKYCFAELFEAKKLGKRLFCVMIEPVPPPQLPDQITVDWQICDLTHQDDWVSFTVSRPPKVPPTEVRFSSAGLSELASGLRKAGLDPLSFVWPPPEEPQRAPFPGLRAMESADAAVFFGRDASIVRAIDQIRLIRERGVEHLFVILGASGAGKSSFLRAGLLPRLQRDIERFVVLPPIRPEHAALSGNHGLINALNSALAARGSLTTPAKIRTELERSGPAGLLHEIEREGQTSDSSRNQRTVIIPIDQAEELLTSDEQGEAQELLRLVGTLNSRAAGERSVRVLVLVTIRSDSLPRLQAHAVMKALSPVLFNLPGMPPTEFKALITGPAQRHSETVRPLVIDPRLADELVADAQGADALPLLALTLEWLYREFTTAEGTRIGQAEYNQLGGVRGVINKAIARAMESPGNEPVIPANRQEQQLLLTRLFPHLATVDPDTGMWKRRTATREAIRLAPPGVDAIVSRLIEQRLLLADWRPTENQQLVGVVEVAHEALLRQWDSLSAWLRELAADLALAEAVRRAAAEWKRGHYDDALLVHTAHRLNAAQLLLADERLLGRFDEVDANYLAACQMRAAREVETREAQLQQIALQQAARAAAQRRFAWGLTVAALLVSGLLVLIIKQTRAVSEQTSRVLSVAAEDAAQAGISDQAVRLAILATRGSRFRPPHPTAKAVLAGVAAGNAVRLVLPGGGDASFSPDGKRLLTVADKSVSVFDARSGRPVGKPMVHRTDVISAKFSNDGRRVLTTSDYQTVRVWDAETGNAIGGPISTLVDVVSASFSPDGKRVLVVTADATATVLDTETAEEVATLDPGLPGSIIVEADFSADGKRVLMASAYQSVWVWDVRTEKIVAQPMAYGVASSSRAALNASERAKSLREAEASPDLGAPMPVGTADFVHFSPDGKLALTAVNDGSVRVWEVETGRTVSEPMNSNGATSGSFSPDGRRVLFASGNTAGVWDAMTGKALGKPMVHADTVFLAAFSPDGKRVVTASKEAVREWDATSGTELSERLHGADVVSASYSPDGKSLVTVGIDQTTKVWDIAPAETAVGPIINGSDISVASFSPDGKLVLTASGAIVRLWDAGTGTPVGEPMVHRAPVSVATFGPDSRHVLTVSRNSVVQVWDAETGRPLSPPTTHDEAVTFGSSSRDGRRVLTVSDKLVHIWDVDTGKLVGQPLPHAHAVSSAQFSPDGNRVLTASNNIARLWDAGTGTFVGEPMIHNAPISAATFSLNGKRVMTWWDLNELPPFEPASPSRDVSVGVWDAATGEPVGKPIIMEHDILQSASISPDGERVVTGADRTLRLWDVATGSPVGEPMKLVNGVRSVSFSADGRRVLSATSGEVRVWDADSGKALSTEIPNFEGKAVPPTLSPDGKYVLVVKGSEARIWRTGWASIVDGDVLATAVCSTMNADAFRITDADVKLAPIISSDRVGSSVCDNLPAYH